MTLFDKPSSDSSHNLLMTHPPSRHDPSTSMTQSDSPMHSKNRDSHDRIILQIYTKSLSLSLISIRSYCNQLRQVFSSNVVNIDISRSLFYTKGISHNMYAGNHQAIQSSHKLKRAAARDIIYGYNMIDRISNINAHAHHKCTHTRYSIQNELKAYKLNLPISHEAHIPQGHENSQNIT